MVVLQTVLAAVAPSGGAAMSTQGSVWHCGGRCDRRVLQVGVFQPVRLAQAGHLWKLKLPKIIVSEWPKCVFRQMDVDILTTRAGVDGHYCVREQNIIAMAVCYVCVLRKHSATIVDMFHHSANVAGGGPVDCARRGALAVPAGVEGDCVACVVEIICSDNSVQNVGCLMNKQTGAASVAG